MAFRAYYSSTGVPDREIAFAYTKGEYFAHITNYCGKKSRVFEYRGVAPKVRKEGEAPIIVQVILMHSYILLQFNSGRAQLFYIDSTKKTFHPLANFEAFERIVTAACIVRGGHPMKKANEYLEPLDFMVTYYGGHVEMSELDWNSGSALKSQDSFYPCPLDLQGSYIVSGIASRRSIGTSQCILLSRKGVAYLIANSLAAGESQPRYKPVVQQDLSPIIGKGHSIIDTSLQTLVIGFKQNTLHVCWIFMGLSNSPQYGHLFSVDTASSRLPFTIIENRSKHPKQGRRTGDEIIISYCEKDGIKESRFLFLLLPPVEGFKHSGTITCCFLRKDLKKEYFNTGDSDGRFCTWALDPKKVNGQEAVHDFKLDGSVTTIFRIVTDIAVGTSQGGLYLFFMGKTRELMPRIPINLGQKITLMASVKGVGADLKFFFIFLEDGTVLMALLVHNFSYTYTVAETIRLKEVSNLPVATKMALCEKHGKDTYIFALGIDGILRRIKLSLGSKMVASEVYRLGWKMSAINELTVGPTSLLMVGDPKGWVFLMLFIDPGGICFHVDQFHKHEIVDVTFYPSDGSGVYLISLDVSGMVVIRRVLTKERPWYPPEFWPCPVKSPRKIEIINGKQIMILGKGVATRNCTF